MVDSMMIVAFVLLALNGRPTSTVPNLIDHHSAREGVVQLPLLLIYFVCVCRPAFCRAAADVGLARQSEYSQMVTQLRVVPTGVWPAGTRRQSQAGSLAAASY
jgi:hypothetical protein